MKLSCNSNILESWDYLPKELHSRVMFSLTILDRLELASTFHFIHKGAKFHNFLIHPIPHAQFVNIIHLNQYI